MRFSISEIPESLSIVFMKGNFSPPTCIITDIFRCFVSMNTCALVYSPLYFSMSGERGTVNVLNEDWSFICDSDTNVDKTVTVRNIMDDKVMGVDRGIRNMAVLSNNIFFNSAQLKDVKRNANTLVKEGRRVSEISARNRPAGCDWIHSVLTISQPEELPCRP